MRRLATVLAAGLAACAAPRPKTAEREVPVEAWSLSQKAGGVSRPFAALEALLAREADFRKGDPITASVFWQEVASFRAFVGEPQEALEAFDLAMATAKREAEAFPAGVTGLDAVEAILKAAESRRAVFLNEAHHAPRDRAFSRRLLKGLHDRGYRYFAAETLQTTDPGLQARGYPVAGLTGYYVHEPVFGELVREALRLGFTPVAYEAQRSCAYDPERPAHCMNERDREQAENLRDRIFKDDPEAKVFVHAGYQHILRKPKTGPSGEWKTMAVVFEELTGIAPLSVDQTVLAPSSRPELDRPAYREAIERLRPEEPMVLVSPEGAPWLVPGESYDMHVLHPRPRLERGRPSWLTRGAGRRLVDLPDRLVLDRTPYLVECVAAGEAADAIPWDRFVVRDRLAPPAAALPAGEYRAKALAPDGTALVEAPLSVR